MKKSNAELISIIPFKEDKFWYLKLVYKYEDKAGKHTVIIPKAGLPFTQGNIPVINNQCGSVPPYINCNYGMILYEGMPHLESERDVATPACYFDIITEYFPREMTLDEIEKELGYKVKIISKE